MGRKGKWRKSRKRERRKDRRQGVDGFLVGMLERSAPIVEAVGSLDRAERLGLIGGSEEIIQTLRKLVPTSRGGEADDPDAERDWVELVRAQGAELEQIRAFAREIEESDGHGC